jgi:hypothetical protein
MNSPKPRYLFLFTLLLVFITLRLIHIDRSQVWLDDSLTLANLSFVAWEDFIPTVMEQIEEITGPVVATYIDSVIVNLFGPNIVLLRLHTVIMAVICLFLLWRLLRQIFPENEWAQYLPLVLFTFSVPSIMYSQQIQPSMYFFFSTLVQLLVFIPFYGHLVNKQPSYRHMLAFIGISVLMFFFNYMSLLMTIVLSFAWMFKLYTLIRSKRIQVKTGLGYTAVYTLLHLAFVLLFIYRPTAEGPNRGYLEPYYLKSIPQFIQHTYDLVTYHFNYAFDMTVYRPLSLNVLSLPFVMLTLIGFIIFLRRNIFHSVYTLFAAFVFFSVSFINVFPYGGTRHSYTLAPFLFIAIGYAFTVIRPEHRRWVGLALPAIAIVTWGLFGWRYYEVKDSRFDTGEILRLAETHDVDVIAAHLDTKSIMELQHFTATGALFPETIAVCEVGNIIAEMGLDEPFLLVAYVSAINPSWKGSILPAELINDPSLYRITHLIEDTGPLPPGEAVINSIYWPVNGFFVYLVEPVGEVSAGICP